MRTRYVNQYTCSCHKTVDATESVGLCVQMYGILSVVPKNKNLALLVPEDRKTFVGILRMKFIIP